MPDTATVRVLHWNIHSWTDENRRSNVDQVAELITATQPDAVSLVEVDEPITGPTPLHRIAAETGYHSAFTPAFEYGTDQPYGQFGNAILTRSPFLDIRHHHLIWPSPTYDGTEPSEPRSLLLARIQANTTPVWVGTTHFPRADHATRKCAAQRVASITSSLPAPWLLLGDFNEGKQLWEDLDPALHTHPTTSTPTYPAHDPVGAIDYCLAPPDQQVQVIVLNITGSDHLPILADLHMRGAPASTSINRGERKAIELKGSPNEACAIPTPPSRGSTEGSIEGPEVMP
jgi:endonuclease/exonuclease/phosphatase family metal-dependent hydrolase